MNSVPVGGRVRITLLSDYTGTFMTALRRIKIIIPPNITWTIPEGKVNNVGGCSILIINRGALIISRADGTNINGGNYAGFRVNNYEQNDILSSPTNLYLVNLNATNNFLVIESGRALFGSRSYGTNQNIQINFALYNIYCDGNIILDGILLRLNGGVGSFQWNSLANTSLNVIDSGGNSVDIKTKIYGMIKDANGIPRNIVSNIVF